MPPAVLLRFGDRSVPAALSDLPAHDMASATDIDSVLPDEGRLLVAGGDAELSVVLTRLLRLERLDLAVAPLRRARLAGRARSGAARAVPLIRDETATVLVGKGLWLPPPGSGQIVGEGIVDDTVLFDGVVTALVLRHLEPLTAADADRLRAFAALHGVQWWLQPKGPDTVHLLDRGGPELAYALPEFGITMPFKPTDFTQVNHLINSVLVGRAVRLLAPGPAERVIDWFCGLGNFTLPLATRAGAVLGIEGSETLVQIGQPRGQRVEQRIDVELGADIHASRGLIE